MRASRLRLTAPLSIVTLAVLFGCKPGSGGDIFASGGSGGGGVSASVTSGEGSTGEGSPQSSAAQFMSGASSGGGTTCVSGADEDKDQDGFTVTQGDCNDCDANVNPAAIEVVVTEVDPETGMVPPPADEDCDMQVDNVPMPCDTGVAMDTTAGLDAAKALELCKVANGPQDWGVVTSSFVRANGVAVSGANLQHGVLPNFGVVQPRRGASMLALSSGHARDGSQSGACGTYSCYQTTAGTPPSSAFPQNAPNCPIANGINDDIGYEVELRAPKNATGYGFDFRFYSFEYPEFVCTQWNDQFLTFVQPPPVGALDGNISFDANTAPVSVNVAFFTVCPGCPDGTADLSGTGFDAWDDAGATAWLQTVAPIGGGETFKVRFAIWDTGDQSWDSTALIDNFHWIANGGTVIVGTNPVPQ